MEAEPFALLRSAGAWDQQALDLSAAAGQLAGAPTAGFTAPVAGAASRFVAAWQRHATGLAAEAEDHAAAVRAALGDLLAVDGAVAGEHQSLGGRLGGSR
ncbi:hypothetical protein [Nocardioides pantholopis]|uniref:hypothetical protein n=1 Tax=Nocardioides pantholopis TaxID=2483798 RepID=UPI0013E33B8C|nr:hypothetical protein [Nocardioides pantholopis]